MRQLSLLNDYAQLAGLMPAIRSAMRRSAGAEDAPGRKALVDTINKIAADGGVKLTGGNNKLINKDTLDKWLSPSDPTHAPNILAVTVFCMATKDMSPLKQILRVVGLDIATEEDMKDAAYGKACRLEREAKKMKRKLEESL